MTNIPQGRAIMSEQRESAMIFETKDDITKAMKRLVDHPQTQECIVTEFQAVYKAAQEGKTKEEKKKAMDAALLDLATRAVLSDLILTMLCNGLPEGPASGEPILIQVKQ